MTKKCVEANIEIFFVDDDQYFCMAFRKKLEGLANIDEFDGFETAEAALDGGKYYDIAVIDLNLHGKNLGFDLLKKAKAKGFCAIILTDHDDQEFIDQAYLDGADLYITKDQGLAAIEKIVKDKIQSKESIYSHTLATSQQITSDFLNQQFITEDEVLLTEIKLLEARIKNVQTILLVGEESVGKSTLAKYINAIWFESSTKLLTIDLSSFSSEHIDESLFAKTKEKNINGNSDDNKTPDGIITKALKKGDSLLIKNVDYLSLKQQTRLEQLISLTNTKSKIIFTSCDDLLFLIKEGNFSVTLFHKISSITITIPSLKNRRSDIVPIINHILKNDSRKIQINKDVIDSLVKYNWPKNVTELKNVIDGLLSLNKGIIGQSDLPPNISENFNPYLLESSNKHFLTTEQFNYAKTHGLKSLVEKVEEEVVKETMTSISMPTRAVKSLKTSLATFYRILRRLESYETINFNNNNNKDKPSRSKYSEKYYRKDLQ